MGLNKITTYSVSCLGGIFGMYCGFKLNDCLYRNEKKKK